MRRRGGQGGGCGTEDFEAPVRILLLLAVAGRLLEGWGHRNNLTTILTDLSGSNVEAGLREREQGQRDQVGGQFKNREQDDGVLDPDGSSRG